MALGRQQSVYLIRAGETEMIKIGRTTADPHLRIRQLQGMHWEELKVIRVIEGNVEELCHRYFSPWHVSREWFRFTPEMLTVSTEYLKQEDRAGRLPPLPISLRCYPALETKIAEARRNLEILEAQAHAQGIGH